MVLKDQYGVQEAIVNQYGELQINYYKIGVYNGSIDIDLFFIFSIEKVSPYPRSKTICRGFKGHKNTSLWFQDYMSRIKLGLKCVFVLLF